MTSLQHNDWTIEVQPTTWAEILLFLSKCGWQPGVPTQSLLASDFTVNEAVALSLAAAGRIVLEETLKDPLGAYSTISFDMGTFAEIVELASEGQFKITNRE